MKRALDSWWVRTLALVLLAAGLAAAGGPRAESAASPAPAPLDEDGQASGEDAAAGRAGVRIYLDPSTGEIRSHPTPEEERQLRPLDPGHRLSRYGGDLLQEPIPQGGFKVDLRGRFQSAVVATIDPHSDTVTLDCVATGRSGDGRSGEPADE